MLGNVILMMALSLLCLIVRAAPIDNLRAEMDLYVVGARPTQDESGSPTWMKTIRWDKGAYGAMDYPRALAMARAYFNAVSQKDRAWSSSTNGNLMVAVLWNPTTETLIASTVPRSSRNIDMKEIAQYTPARAHRWVKAAERYIRSPQAYCAEDSAIVAYEGMMNNGLNPDKKTFPSQTFMAVWGAKSIDKANQKTTAGQIYPPCPGKRGGVTFSGISGSCQNTLNTLQIAWIGQGPSVPSTQHFPPIGPPPTALPGAVPVRKTISAAGWEGVDFNSMDGANDPRDLAQEHNLNGHANPKFSSLLRDTTGHEHSEESKPSGFVRVPRDSIESGNPGPALADLAASIELGSDNASQTSTAHIPAIRGRQPALLEVH